MTPVHGSRTYTKGTSAVEDREDPEVRVEVTCAFCEDWASLSMSKMVAHASSWCENSPEWPDEEIREEVEAWFQIEAELDAIEADDDREEDNER